MKTWHSKPVLNWISEHNLFPTVLVRLCAVLEFESKDEVSKYSAGVQF